MKLNLQLKDELPEYNNFEWITNPLLGQRKTGTFLV